MMVAIVFLLCMDYGCRWSLIAGRLPGRTDNEIKNYWNTNLSKRLNQCNNQAPNTLTTYHKKLQKDQKNKKPISIDQHKQTLESNVVRTKAVRCTKVFITPEPQPQQHILHANNITDVAAANHSSMVYNEDDSSLGLDEDYNLSSDFMMEDFNMGDFNLISELLTTNYSDVCDFSTECSNNASDLSPNSPEQPFVFSQELLEDWLGDQQVM